MIWPFTSCFKPTTEYKARQLSEIRIGTKIYTPQADITPQEVVFLIPVLASFSWGLRYDEWIEKHKLERHFTEVKEEE